MVLDLKRLKDQTLITTTDKVNLVTNPLGKRTVILSVLVHNNGSNYPLVSLFNRPDVGGNIGADEPTTQLISQIILYPQGVHGAENEWEGRIELEDENDSFWIQVSEINTVTVFVNGLQETLE